VYIDVSLPEGLAARIELALKRKTPLVIGTTGLSASDLALVDKASAQIPILQTSNFSLGMTLMQKLAKEAAIAFHADADIELVETHHTEKKDAPSGSAKMLAETVADAHPLKKKPSIRSVRLGKVVGEHVLSFLAPEEQIVLSHTAHSRDVFARGALAAARFLKEQLPGRYQMSDLIA
jgi:4-hydroxy-tetrahydrodipicolinate reductase